jgi:GWxTD domain-containing protein
VSQRVVRVLLVVALLGGCGPRPWWTASQVRPAHPNSAPFDAREMYRAMGFIVDSASLRFVGSLRFLASPVPDSTLALFSMSLATRALSFLSEGEDFIADYHVDLAFRNDSNTGREVGRDETVRVHSIAETQRVDESVIFQLYVRVRPGTYTVSAVVRDLHSPSHGEQQIVDTVPRFEGAGLATPIPIYQGTGRTRLGVLPDLIVNPRATLISGPDSLRLYVEGYQLAPGARVAARFVDRDTVELWHDTMTVSRGPDGALSTALFVIRPGELPLGRGEFRVEAIGGGGGAVPQATAPLLISFSDRWAVATFDQMLNLLKFFARQDLVTKLRTASRADRAAAWREFYRASDPDPKTPQNEALDEYVHRIDLANRRYQEYVDPGWLTDRGEVFITLGEPDRTAEVPGKMTGGLRWEYDHPHVTLYFEDVSGLGQYRLTPESRTDYQNALTVARRTP